jgi:hypothetical protein
LDPAKLSAFFDRREQQVNGVNNQISLYLASRQGFGTNIQPDSNNANSVALLENLVKGCTELGVGLMTLYGMVLALEGLLDEFMSRTEVGFWSSLSAFECFVLIFVFSFP